MTGDIDYDDGGLHSLIQFSIVCALLFVFVLLLFFLYSTLMKGHMGWR
jgi:hypothetical protein